MTNTLGVDVGGSFIKALRLEADGAIDKTFSIPLPVTTEEMMEAVVAAAAALRTAGTAGVGVGMAGLVRWPEGVFAWGPHLPGEEIPVLDRLQEALGLAVTVDNDVNCAVLAELHRGAAAGFRHVVMVTIGTGIGGGIIFDSAIYRGSSFAGELGHMTMVPNGELCACGHRGCWETLVADATVQPWLAEARAGGLTAGRKIAETGRWLGRGLVNLVAVLDPEVIVVGGGVMVAAGDLLLPVARAEVETHLPGGSVRSPVEIRTAAAGPWAGALGAALLAEEVLSQSTSGA